MTYLQNLLYCIKKPHKGEKACIISHNLKYNLNINIKSKNKIEHNNIHIKENDFRTKHEIYKIK